MKLDLREKDGVAILVLSGQLTGGGGDEELREAIDTLLASGRNRILVDFRDVTFMDSQGVSALVDAHRSLGREGVRFVLANPPGRVARLLELTGLDQVIELDEHHELVSLGDTSMTPWECPRDYPESHMVPTVKGLFEQVRNPAGAIVNMHCPPRDTSIDQAPKLNDRLEIEFEAGQVLMTSAGSAAIRTGLEALQPLLSLHGHIHEARGTHRIGRTLCLNPGSEYAEGIMKAAIVNLEPERVKGYLLISG